MRKNLFNLVLLLMLLFFFLPIVIIGKEIKLDWENIFSGDDNDYYTDIKYLDDGGILILGDTWSTDLGAQEYNDVIDTFLVKYDNDGKLLWKNTWGGNCFDNLTEMFLQSDGGIILAGYSDSDDIPNLTNIGDRDIVIVKYDKDGNLLWQKNYGTESDDEPLRLLPLENDSFILVGIYDGAVIMKFDKDGNIIWNKAFGSEIEKYYYLNIFKDYDNSFIVSGTFYKNEINGLTSNGSADIFIIKYDEDGNVLWRKNWGGTGVEELKKLLLSDDGNYITIGKTKSEDLEGITSEDFVVEYDKNGNVITQKNLEETEYKETDIFSKFEWLKDEFNKIYNSYIDKGNNVIVVGNPISYDNVPSEQSIVFLISKYDKNGNLIFQKPYFNTSTNYVKKVYQIDDSNFVIVVQHQSDERGAELITLKYSLKYEVNILNQSSGGTVSVEKNNGYGIIVPKADNGYEIDKVIVRDSFGNEIEVLSLEDGTYSFDLYDDVSVEVLFKETLVNPKTGVSSYIGVMFTIFIIGICALFMIRNCNSSYEL